jgi:hypothetical protein
MLKLIAAVIFALPAPAGAASSCVRFGDIVTLTGRYVLDVVAAPSPGADEPTQKRTSNLLYLATPLCVDSDDLSEGVSAAGNVQVLCPDLGAGSQVSITGRLFGAHTGNGHTPVLLVCQSSPASTH